jgi:hypothetical protein
MRIDPFGTSWLNSVGNWFVSKGKAIGNFVEDNWDVIVGVGLVAASVGISIATFGAGTVVAGVVLGGLIGGSVGGLSALVSGGDPMMGFVSGAFVGAVGGVSGWAAFAGAAGMSLISDRVNGQEASFKGLAKAVTAGATAGLFAGASNMASGYMLSGSTTFAERAIVSSISATTFSTHNFVTDTLINQLIGW